MDQSALFLTLNRNWNDAIQWVNQQLTEAGMRTVSTFDFQMARSAQVACTCPHHGTQACSCQMVVLLVYDDNQTPVSLLVHGYEDNTWFYMADAPSQLRNLELGMTVRQILERKKLEMENAMNTSPDTFTQDADTGEIIDTIQSGPMDQVSRLRAWLNKHKLIIL